MAKKIILPLILFFMIGLAIVSATTLFSETFGNTDWRLSNLGSNITCDIGDFELDDIWDTNPYNVTLDNTWKCWTPLPENYTNYYYLINLEDDGIVGYNTLTGLRVYTGVSNFSYDYKHSALVHKFDTTQNFNATTNIDFYCVNQELRNNVSDWYSYLVFTNFTSLTSFSEAKVVINLGHNDSVCSVPETSFYPILNLSKNCCILTDVVGGEDDCQSDFTEHPSFSVQDLLDNCPSLSINDFQGLDYAIIYTQASPSPSISGSWYFDDLTISSTPPTPANVSFTTYYEDFEDASFVYKDITSFVCSDNQYFNYTGSIENPNITACSEFDDYSLYMNRSIQESSSTLDGSSTSLFINQTIFVSEAHPNQTYVFPFIVNLQNYNITLNNSFSFSVDMRYADYDYYLTNLFTPNVVLKVTDTDNDYVSIAYKGDYAISGYCRLSSLSIPYLKNNDTWIRTKWNWDSLHSDGTCWTQAIDLENDTLKDIRIYITDGMTDFNSKIYLWLDNINITSGVSNITPPTPPTPPFNFTSITYFNETFTTTRDFYYDKNNCSNVCFNSQSCFTSFNVEPLDLDNNWYCSEDSGVANTIYLQDTSDTTKIETAKGLDVVSDTFLNIGTRSKYFVSFFPNTTDLSAENMTFSWTCNIPTQASSVDVFLGLADSSTSQKVLIGMGKDDTQNSRCNDTGLGLTTTNCCDLSQIVGQANDCKTSTKTKVSITEKQIVDSCPEIGDLDFTSINQIGFWIYTYNLVSLNQFYLDDLQVYNSLTEVGNNTLPVVASVFATPNPANVSQPVNWDVYVYDDDVVADIYTAFDCNNDGTLEYNWAIRPTNISKVWNFTCSAYGSVGFKTAKAYASDTTHYPYGVNASNTGQVEVKLIAVDEGERGGSCSGFTAPTCSGECVFYDDFNYNYAITCNGWDGTDKHPRNQMMRIDNMNASEFSIERNFDNIYDYEYNSFIFSLDFKIDTTDRITMTIDDASSGKYLPYIYWENGFLYSLDSVSPYVQNLGNYTIGETYTLLGVANFNTNKITYSVFGTNYTPEFFDIDIAKVNRITFNWYSGTNFTIDNVLIAKGTANENGTAPVTYSNYVYDGDMFCAINWTQDKPRFSWDNCLARGYSSNPALASLCLPRACISDTGSFIINTAQKNILQTIIIAVAFILIAPLFVALVSRKR